MSARLKLMISMIIFGTLGLFVRNISLNSGELALYRAILAALFIGIYLFLSKQKICWKEIGRELPILFVSGIAMGMNWIFLFEAYKYTTVSIATLSYYFAPVIVTVVCPLLFHEKLTWKNIICFLMSTAGLVLIIGVGGNMNETAGKGIIYGLGAATLYATVIILNKCVKKVAGLPRTLLQFFAAILILMPYVAYTGGIHLQQLDFSGWICLLIVGLVHTGITYCLYFTALKDLKGQETAILSYIDPLVAVVVSVLLLNEKITLWQLAGGILILGFTLLNEIDIPIRQEKEG